MMKLVVVALLLISSAASASDIRSYGAKLDGTTNDTAAWQRAAAACDPSISFPVGRSVVTETVTWKCPTYIYGAGLVCFNQNPCPGSTILYSGSGVAFDFNSGGPQFSGSTINGINFVDQTGQATLVRFFNMRNWLADRVTFHGAAVGLSSDGGPLDSSLRPTGDSSWGRIRDAIGVNCHIIVDEPNPWGGFLADGGNYEPGNGNTAFRIRGNQVRIVGVKVDGGQYGVDITGYADEVVDSHFEGSTYSIFVHVDSSLPGPYWHSGQSNTLLGNLTYGRGVLVDQGIGTVVLGNHNTP